MPYSHFKLTQFIDHIIQFKISILQMAHPDRLKWLTGMQHSMGRD
jgi:hypothetical protein